ncbi:dihydrodipicolinate synthase family protein [Stenotrophomonas maltophilia]|nr:dihydrodipicolinate synthase family protein [Stenotrophomonas maltophilia]
MTGSLQDHPGGVRRGALPAAPRTGTGDRSDGGLQGPAARVARLRAKVPSHITIGISGDSVAARGLNAGCEVWYSVIGGLFPEIALQITRLSVAGRAQDAQECSDRLQPLWALFDKHGGSIRVVATAAELLGLCSGGNLPRPLQTLTGNDRAELAAVLAATGLA